MQGLEQLESATSTGSSSAGLATIGDDKKGQPNKLVVSKFGAARSKEDGTHWLPQVSTCATRTRTTNAAAHDSRRHCRRHCRYR